MSQPDRNDRTRSPYLGMGAVIGIGGFGLVLGVLMNAMVMGMLIGTALGTVAGAVVETRRRQEQA